MVKKLFSSRKNIKKFKKRMNGGSQKFCTRCGAPLDLDLNHKFCTQCGTPIKKKSIKNVSKKKYCFECGALIDLSLQNPPIKPPSKSAKKPSIRKKTKRHKITQCELIRGIKSQDIAQDYKGTGKNIAILVAGNAGRPGGVLGKMDGSGLTHHYKPPYKYTTQEEDIVASWLQAEEKKFNNPTFNPNIVFRKNLGSYVSGGRKWGMKYPELHVGTPKSTHTIQKRDFTHPFYDMVNGHRMDQAQNYNFAYTLKNKPIFDSDKTNIIKTDLVFVYGPNVAYIGTSPNSSGTRTLVKDYQGQDRINPAGRGRDYNVFRECVKTALKAGLNEMYNNKIKIAILAPISGGIYSGKGTDTHRHINKEYIDIVNEILNEDDAILGKHFERVIFPKL